jgi:hypothetical protein
LCISISDLDYYDAFHLNTAIYLKYQVIVK